MDLTAAPSAVPVFTDWWRRDNRGASRVLDIFADELRRTVTLVGVSTISELKARGPEVIRDLRNAARSTDATIPTDFLPDFAVQRNLAPRSIAVPDLQRSTN